MAEELVGGCISKKIWDQMCANMLDLENATLEEIEAGLDPDFVPEGRLDPPTPPKKLKLSLSKKKTECTSELSASKASKFAIPVSEKEINEAAKGVGEAANCALLSQTVLYYVLYYSKVCSIFPIQACLRVGKVP